MRLFVFIPDPLVEKLRALADAEHRYPQQQASWLLQKAIEQATHDAQGSEAQEGTYVGRA
jgi:hypothetical protein